MPSFLGYLSLDELALPSFMGWNDRTTTEDRPCYAAAAIQTYDAIQVEGEDPGSMASRIPTQVRHAETQRLRQQ
jgi:hypothetical protein